MRYTVVVDEEFTFWYKEGTHIRHRENGPAVEDTDGNKEWWQNGKYHRLDGPAVECVGGHHQYYIEGKGYSKEDFDAKVKELSVPPCQDKVVEIEGIKYKLTKV